MKKYLSFAGLVGIILLSGCEQTTNTETEKLHAIFDRSWEMTMTNYPMFATATGDHRFNDRLADMSLDAVDKRNQQDEQILNDLLAIDVEKLPANEKINYEIFKRLLENEIGEYKYKTYLQPITSRDGFHVSFPQLADDVPLKSLKDYQNYLARINAFPTYCDQYISLLRQGVSEGYVLPQVIIADISNALSPQIVEQPEQSLLYHPFADLGEKFTEQEREQLQSDARQAIMERIVPAYKKLDEFMRQEYIPSARQDVAASGLPEGKPFYEHRVRYYTSLDLTPEQVHQTGLSEVKRIRTEMDKILEKVQFKGDFKSFVRFLRTDPRFYVNTPDDLMKEVSFVLKKMDGALPILFGKLPRMPYGIKRIPDFIAPKTTTAYYSGPAGDGTRAGFYFVNTYDLKSRPLYEIEALSLHEAVPGHHLQIALQQEMENMPVFRKFSGFTAFVEGWALYAERLGMEVGFYKDPYNDFGRLTYEMWRACRLVVDTGMHYLGWTRQQAIDFMAGNTALTLLNITNEVDRYIAWPGQALAYKTGELKIRELRQQAESELGDSFDVRNFHDQILKNGALPLDLLESEFDLWLADQKNSMRN